MNRKSQKLSFIREIVGCLISPRSSFKSVLEKPSLLKATTLILLIALVAALATFNYRGKLPVTYLLQQRPGVLFPRQGASVNPEQFHHALMFIDAMMGLIGVFATWLISSALIHGFSSRLGEKGTFRSMLTLSGYASTPLLIQQILRLVDSFMVSQEELLQLATNFQLSADPLLNTLAKAAVNIFTIFRLWSIILLIIAIHENYRMSTIRSIIVVVLSFIIIVFVSLVLPFT